MSLFRTTESIAAMTARIQKNVDLAGLVADGDDLILADIVDEVVAGIRNLRVVANEIPAPREDPLQFELVERFVGMNPPVQPTCLRIEQRADGRAVPPIVCIVSFLCHFHAPGLWASLGSEAGKTLAQRPRAAQGRSFGKIDYSSSSDVMPQTRRAGATILSEPTDQDYGQREYAVCDPDGHSWWIATPTATPALEGSN